MLETKKEIADLPANERIMTFIDCLGFESYYNFDSPLCQQDLIFAEHERLMKEIINRAVY